MYKKILTIAFLIAAIAGFGMLVPKKASQPSVDDHGALKIYTNSDYGISFEYPDSYVIEEHSGATMNPPRFDIVLMNAKDYADLKAATVPREGPLAITISIFPIGARDQSLNDWIKTSDVSNWKLSNGAFASTTVAGLEALYYSWDGLYRGDTLAFASEDVVYTGSVTSLSPEDPIRHDFDHLMQTLRVDSSSVEI